MKIMFFLPFPSHRIPILLRQQNLLMNKLHYVSNTPLFLLLWNRE